MHLDIKPANIIIARNYVAKISDFGEAFHQNVPYMKPGRTVPYFPPEYCS